MSTAAQLGGVVAHAHHAHVVFIFFTKQRHGTGGLGRLQIHQLGGDFVVGADLVVDQLLDPANGRHGQPLEVGEVKAHALSPNQRTFLSDMLAQCLTQGSVQQVSHGVVQGDGLTTIAINHGFHFGALLQSAQLHVALVDDRLARFQGVGHGKDAVVHFQGTAVANLAAGLGVEGGLFQHDDCFVTGDETAHLFHTLVDADHASALAQGFVTGEGGLEVELEHLVVVHAEAGRFLGTSTLLLHLGLEALFVDADLALAHHVGSQVGREAVSVVELEHHFARNNLGIAQVGQNVFQQQQTAIQSADKLLLFDAQHSLDQRQLGDQLGSDVFHLHRQLGSQFVEEDVGGTQLAAVTHGAADDAAQHIATTFVGRHHAICHQEGAGADVVSDDAQGLVAQIGGADNLGRFLDQRLEDVDFVVGVDTLHDGGDPLQSHAGIHGRTRQRLHGAVSLTVELHEHHVPDLDETVAILFR